MTQNLRQNFIHLSYGRLGAHCASKLGLDHRKGAFGVTSTMIVAQEFGAIQVIKVKCTLPQAIVFVMAAVGHRIGFEGDVCRSTNG